MNSIHCSGDAYGALSEMARLGTMNLQPGVADGPFEAALRRLAGKFDDDEKQRLRQLQKAPPKKRRRRPSAHALRRQR